MNLFSLITPSPKEIFKKRFDGRDNTWRYFEEGQKVDWQCRQYRF
jgi:hypothetical protein